jgi:hypothetical protein
VIRAAALKAAGPAIRRASAASCAKAARPYERLSNTALLVTVKEVEAALAFLNREKAAPRARRPWLTALAELKTEMLRRG